MRPKTLFWNSNILNNFSLFQISMFHPSSDHLGKPLNTFLLWFLVVSIGVDLAFKFIFTPLEYSPTMAKRLNFFGSGFLHSYPASSIFVLYFFVEKSARNIKLPNIVHNVHLSIDIYYFHKNSYLILTLRSKY